MDPISKVLGVPDIAPDELHRLMRAGEVLVFDVNPRRSWEKAHVPGARLLDPQFAPSDLPVDKTARIVFYCSGTNCGAGPYAARRARKMGSQTPL